MALRNTSQNYGSLAKFFHWTVSFIVLALLCIGPFMADIGSKDLQRQVMGLHKSFGLTVLTLMTLRILWRWTNTHVQPLTTKRWERTAERAAHACFYLLLLAQPLSGFLMSSYAGYPTRFFNLFTLPTFGIEKNKPIGELFNQGHTYIACIIAALVLLHVLAALKHHYVNKDNVLRRMMPGVKISE